MSADLPYRPNTCLIIKNKEGKFFLAERNGCPGIWQFPQGGIEKGMSAEENSLKEAHEELGVPATYFKIVKHLKAQHQYDFEEPVPERHRGKWRGQSQTFFILEYLGSDDEICLDRYDKELMTWKWCSIEEVRALAEPRRLVGYEKAFHEIGI